MEVKETSKGAKRQLAKVCLSSLYGRMAATKETKKPVDTQRYFKLKEKKRG